MFAVIARFPAAAERKQQLLDALDASLEVTQRQPGFVAYQVLAPASDDDTRVCLMLWQSREHFQTFVKSDASRQAHAQVTPELFREPPGIEQLNVLDTFHAP